MSTESTTQVGGRGHKGIKDLERAEMMHNLWKYDGYTQVEIASMYDIKYQGVQYIIKKYAKWLEENKES